VYEDDYKKKVEDLIFDLDSGEMLTKEECHRRQEAKNMDEIGEEDEEYDEEEDEDDENDGGGGSEDDDDD
jgi:hypothetical protein